jgi:protein-tyrosine phosphatase
MLLLALVGVPAEDIAADYELSAERLATRYATRGEPDQNPVIDAFLAERGTTGGELIVATLADLDIKAHLQLGDHHVTALRERVVSSGG